MRIELGQTYDNRRTRVSGEQIGEIAAGGVRVQAGFANKVAPVPLTPELIEGFVITYLHARYEDPQPIPQLHRDLWAWYCLPDEWGSGAAPRGHAKSTCITLAGALADLLFRNEDYIVIVSSVYGVATEFLQAITAEVTENEKLIEDFGIRRIVKSSEDNLIVEMRDRHRWRVKVLGVEGRIRGLKWGHKRPSKFLLDDIEDDEQVENKERREKLSKWVLKALIPAGRRKAKVRMVGTIMHFDSFLANSLKSSSWKSVFFRAHKSFDDFSEILWPEMFSEERLKKIRQLAIDAGDPDGYSQEYLNNPISERTAYFKRSNLLPIPAEIKTRILTGATRLRLYIGWDFAVSKEDRTDFTRYVVVGVDFNNYKYVLSMGGGRWDTKEIIDKLFELDKEFSPGYHAVEKGVIEKSLGPWIATKSQETGRYPLLYKLTSSTDKLARGRPWQGATENHHVFYNQEHSDYQTLADEMVRFPRGEHDDFVDAQTILGRALQDMQAGPTEEEAQQEDDDEMLDLVKRRLAAAGAQSSGRNAVTGY